MGVLENWKPVVGYKSLYEVSNLGRVRTLNYRNRKGDMRLLKPGKAKNHYFTVSLHDGTGTGKSHTVHRLVAAAFIPNLGNHPVVNHINGDKSDNRAENLEWCTVSYNGLHSYELGRKPGHVKLDLQTVRRIKTMAKTRSFTDIYKELNLNPSTVHSILSERSWKWVRVV